MSKWESTGIRERVLEVLEAVKSDRPEHRFGTPFLTAYQIAIAVESTPREAGAQAWTERLDLPLGGKGTGVHYSLSQYIARQLSQVEDVMVEGLFLSAQHIKSLQFEVGKDHIDSSVVGDAGTISMFRIR